MKSLKTLAAITTAVLSMACTQVETGRIVLQGEITGNPGEVIVVSYLPGQRIGYHYPEVEGGRFEFSLDGIEGFTDLIVSVGGVEFGARVNALDTLRMSFVVNKYLEDVEVSYDGANEKESRIWTDFYETYLHWSNYDIIAYRDESIPYEESIAKFERCDSIFRAKHKADFNDYYEHRTELAHDLLKSILLEMMSERDGVKPFEYPEYVEMLQKVDPNDPDQVVFPMVNRWMSYKLLEFEGSMVEKCVAFLQKYGSSLKNPAVNAMLVDYMAMVCMEKIDADRLDMYEPFFAELEKFVPSNPELVAGYRRQIDAIRSTMPGSSVPDTTMKTPEGEDVMLSSLFGKVLYVDAWATWCGPCINEGPYFRALAEKYKDDPRICFVSVSLDSTDKPWLEFLAEEKPFWPQYRLDGASQDEFCDKVGLNTIPRFFLIDAEGRFIYSDCARPSSEGIEQILNEAINR